MSQFNRRTFISSAAAMGATLLWAGSSADVAPLEWRERRDLFPQGVASAGT
jgi:alkaline phosphatase D